VRIVHELVNAPARESKRSKRLVLELQDVGPLIVIPFNASDTGPVADLMSTPHVEIN